jgi:D-xylose transport system permease protein
MLLIIGEGGTIGIDDPILDIMNANMSPLAGWILFAIVVGGWALLSLNKMRSRRAPDCPSRTCRCSWPSSSRWP